MVKSSGSESFSVSGGVVGRLGFRVGVSASYSYFRRVRNFGIVRTAAVSLPTMFKKLIQNILVATGFEPGIVQPAVHQTTTLTARPLRQLVECV